MNKTARLCRVLVQITEQHLTHRAYKKHMHILRQKKRGHIQDWLMSFLWAVGFVLLLNQYFIQGYQIPSGSMIPTLQIRDKIFVNKLVFGPEVLPGFVKIAPLTSPNRFDVVVFENPDYLSRGVLFEVLQRVLYMASLSLLDINRDEYGRPKVQFLIKRLVGMPGDELKLVNGKMHYKIAGTNSWQSEAMFKVLTDAKFANNNPALDVNEANALASYYAEQRYLGRRASYPSYNQFFDMERAIALHEYELSPTPLYASPKYASYKNGWYVADDRYFFMGDNRDNSRDSRYYSGVSLRKILGKAMIIYLPVKRFSLIR